MVIGIIGLGDMGKLYAITFAKAGYTVIGCDIPENQQLLSKELQFLNIQVLEDGVAVSKQANFILFAVEAERIWHVVSHCAHAVKPGAIVGGLTSVKYPEIMAFEQYLPRDVHIVTCHPLHGPAFLTQGQQLIIIAHRATNQAYKKARDIYAALESNITEIPDYHIHDQIVADTQVLTHMGFESMGTAWKNAGFYPWNHGSFNHRGIDHVKTLATLRIFSYKAHIYAGMAILNPYARKQVRRYRASVSDLFKMMVKEDETAFRDRIYKAKDFIFRVTQNLLKLSEQQINSFKIHEPMGSSKPNSHLSLLAMVDGWYHLNVNPYQSLICQTPPFRLRLGIAERLFCDKDLLEESIEAALFNKEVRGCDLEFYAAVREWTSVIEYGDMRAYISQFNEVKDFFADYLQDGALKSTQFIEQLSR